MQPAFCQQSPLPTWLTSALCKGLCAASAVACHCFPKQIAQSGPNIMCLTKMAGYQVRLAERLERFWGRRGAVHLCVSRAMQQELASGWGIQATVFHDRPPASFRPTPLDEAHVLWQRLLPALVQRMHPQDFCSTSLQPLVDLLKEAGSAEFLGTRQAHYSHESSMKALLTGSMRQNTSLCLERAAWSITTSCAGSSLSSGSS